MGVPSFLGDALFNAGNHLNNHIGVLNAEHFARFKGVSSL